MYARCYGGANTVCVREFVHRWLHFGFGWTPEEGVWARGNMLGATCGRALGTWKR
ncbi:phosphomannomutase [Anopheles sinensis]|uniref:Phosphomannomutase n=1 Tax=Anopheles sinensis TaxID=74873 RepID=A0A084VTY0_ANOSI|nr:phosphomannomutase [Anopheles sinensis]